ncbi:unnamed protein product [Orchesella dallaii]|uniref:Uncharacterized protein n=1 Tax=Orchesella dallaii TaxID=48710 RepID=A0ABP1R2U0_9HEXA
MVGPQHAEKVEWLYLNSCTDLRTTTDTRSKRQNNPRSITQTEKIRDASSKDSKSNPPSRSSHSLTRHRSSSRDPQSTHNVRARKAFKKVCSSLLPVEDLRKERDIKDNSQPNINLAESNSFSLDPVTCKKDFLDKLHRLAGTESKSGKQEMSGDSIETETIKLSKSKPILKADTSTSTPALKSTSTQSQAAAVESEKGEETEDEYEDSVESLSDAVMTGTQLALAGIFLFIIFYFVKKQTGSSPLKR